MNPRVLITGASGLLGRDVYKIFSAEPQWQVLGLAFDRANGNLKKVDVTNAEEVHNVISDFKPTAIIHCAAMRGVNKSEKNWEMAAAVNVEGTWNICKEAERTKAFVIYISSYYVFDGRNPPHKPDSKTNPLSKYGQSKLYGEQATLATSEDNIVIRVPHLYGDHESFHESPFFRLYEILVNQKEMKQVDDYCKQYPANTTDVAHMLQSLVRYRLADKSVAGILHWTDNECFTEYEIMKLMAELYNLPMDHIEPVKNLNLMLRPRDPCMDMSRMQEMGLSRHTPFRQALKACMEPLFAKNGLKAKQQYP